MKSKKARKPVCMCIVYTTTVTHTSNHDRCRCYRRRYIIHRPFHINREMHTVNGGGKKKNNRIEFMYYMQQYKRHRNKFSEHESSVWAKGWERDWKLNKTERNDYNIVWLLWLFFALFYMLSQCNNLYCFIALAFDAFVYYVQS